MSKNFYTYVNQHFDKILVKEYDEYSNVPKFYTIDYQPTVYIPTNKKSDYKNLAGQYLAPTSFESISEMRNFFKKYKDVSNFQIYGMDNPTYAYIEDTYKGDGISYDLSKIRIGFFDIETATSDENGKPTGFPEPKFANNTITAITLYYNGIYYALGLKDYTPKVDNVKYVKCASEVLLLKTFIKLLQKFKLDILSGYNIDYFDTPYIYNRMVKLGFSKAEISELSPFNIVKSRIVSGDESQEDTQIIDIYGTSLIDYYVLFKKYSGKSLESYKLDYVASEVLGERKTDYSDYNTLDELYNKNFELFMEYNIQDVKLLVDIENKTKLMVLIILIAYLSKTNFNDVFKQTRIWDQIIYTYLLERNIIIPYTKPHILKSEKYQGAYVKDPQIGMHNWAVSFDLTSLYPSLIMQYNLGVDTLSGESYDIDYRNIIDTERNVYYNSLKRNNYAMAANGTLYNRDKKSFLNELMIKFFNLRKEYKNEYLKADGLKNDILNEIKKRGLKV